jgi:hypothetical protein
MTSVLVAKPQYEMRSLNDLTSKVRLMKSLQKNSSDLLQPLSDFLESRQGVLLHELGHYVAANIGGLVSGYIIVEDRDDRDCSGAFHIARVSRQHLEASPPRRELTAAAGALVEIHFCNSSVLRRLGPDVEMYFAPNLIRQIMYQTDRDAAVSLWQERHLDLIEEHADCIEKNFERCATFLSEGRYLVHGYHVIPTSALISPAPRSLVERFDDYLRTRARVRALTAYLQRN